METTVSDTKAMTTSEYSLGKILSDLLSTIFKNEQPTKESQFLHALFYMYNSGSPNTQITSDVCKFKLDDDSTSEAIKYLKTRLQSSITKNFNSLNSPISYLLDELICNIQQHAQADSGYAYINYNKTSDSIEIAIADRGITIYGSYVNAQKHLDMLGDSDALALSLAQNGYSVKDLPDTENRGYGISSNMRMVVEGLKGEFAILSGNALLVHFSERKEVLSLPKEIDFKGTMAIVRFPAHVPVDFDFYKYIS